DLGELAGGLLEDRALGARRVVLGQLADAIEQLRAARVIEMLGGKLLEGPREPVQHIVGERALLVAVKVRVDANGLLCNGVLGRGRLHQRSLASRTPAKIWRRCGRSQLRNVGSRTRGWVAQEPPRRTR